MAVTMNDVAKKAGVARATVSYILNKNLKSLSMKPETRARVFKVADELNFQPSFLGRSLASGQTFTIGLLSGGIDNPHFSELSKLIYQEAQKQNYKLLISFTEYSKDKELGMLHSLMSRQIDGLILLTSPFESNSELHKMLLEKHYPIVMGSSVGRLSGVDSEWGIGFRETFKYLIEKGYKKIAYLEEILCSSFSPKKQAYLECCQKHNLQEILFECRLGHAIEFGEKISEFGDCPKVVIAASDYTATRFIRGLYNKGLKVPDDIAVVGIDGTDHGKNFIPRLTTIASNREHMASEMVNMIIKMISDNKTMPKKVFLPTNLLIGESA